MYSQHSCVQLSVMRLKILFTFAYELQVCWRFSLEILLPFNSDVLMLFTVLRCFSEPSLTIAATMEWSEGTTGTSQPTQSILFPHFFLTVNQNELSLVQEKTYVHKGHWIVQWAYWNKNDH